MEAEKGVICHDFGAKVQPFQSSSPIVAGRSDQRSKQDVLFQFGEVLTYFTKYRYPENDDFLLRNCPLWSLMMSFHAKLQGCKL